MERQYTYQLYKNDVFQGDIPKVISDFNVKQQINTAGAQLQVTAAINPDDAGAVNTTEYLLKDDGYKLITENGSSLLISSVYSFETIAIDPGNRMKVMLYSSDYPNGTQVFDGVITSITYNAVANTITLNVLSWGIQMNNIILEGLLETINQSQELQNSYYELGPQPDTFNALAQSFKVSTTGYISSVDVYMLYLQNGTGCKLSLISGTPESPGSVLGSITRDVTNTSAAFVKFSFATPISVNSTDTYHWKIECTQTGIFPAISKGGHESFHIFISGSSSYANGKFYTYDPVSGSTTDDAAFHINMTTPDVNPSYTGYDPSNILKSAVDVFNNKGGIPTYSSSSIDLTLTSVSYTFKLNTILEVANKVLELSPAGWYWYVDVGTNTLHLHNMGITADHIFTIGKHIEDLSLDYTIENLKNKIYFSGGDTGGGENLFRLATNDYSIAQYGIWLDRVSDNRVTLSSTADLLNTTILNNNSKPSFRTTVIISADTYNIESINLGDMIAFNNTNSFISSLLLQVVETTRENDKITLLLNSIPPAVSKTVQELKRDLNNLQTIDNPSSPN